MKSLRTLLAGMAIAAAAGLGSAAQAAPFATAGLSAGTSAESNAAPVSHWGGYGRYRYQCVPQYRWVSIYTYPPQYRYVYVGTRCFWAPSYPYYW